MNRVNRASARSSAGMDTRSVKVRASTSMRVRQTAVLAEKRVPMDNRVMLRLRELTAAALKDAMTAMVSLPTAVNRPNHAPVHRVRRSPVGMVKPKIGIRVSAMMVLRSAIQRVSSGDNAKGQCYLPPLHAAMQVFILAETRTAMVRMIRPKIVCPVVI